METTEDRETQILESKTEAIVGWLKLTGIPTADQIDPDGKLGLKDAFRKYNGFYADPIPQNVIDQAKNKVLDGKTKGEPIEIPLLEQTDLHGKTTPLFREHVFSVAQYVAKLGFELPLPEGTEGEGFVMVDPNARKKTVVTTSGSHISIHETFKTKDPNIFIEFGRRGSSDAPVASIGLRIQR